MCPETGGAGVTCGWSAVTRVGRGSDHVSVVRAGALPKLLLASVLALLLNTAALRIPRRASSSPTLLGSQGCAHPSCQALLCQIPIPKLRPLVVDHDADDRTEVFEQNLALVVGEDFGVRQVPRQFDTRRSFVCVLSTGPSRRGESLAQFCVWDHQERLDGNGHPTSLRTDSTSVCWQATFDGRDAAIHDYRLGTMPIQLHSTRRYR